MVKSCFHAHILLVVDEIFVTKSVQTRFVAPQKPLIGTFFIKVIISYDKFIAIDSMKKFGARSNFSDFHRQKFSRQQEPDLREQITENMINI